MTTQILIVDDDATQRSLIDDFLSSKGYQCAQAEDGFKALTQLKKISTAMVIMDMRMPGMTGLETLREIRKDLPSLPVLLITAYADIRDAVDAIKDGAIDYLAKPIDLQELAVAVEDTVGSLENKQEISLDIPADVVAKSPAVLSLLSELSIVAPSDASVLITGESGTGKEVIANLLHHWSKRKDRDLIKVNCAAIPGNLMESELFGHEKGAFSGAVQKRKGYFDTADGGTLFLDEIGEMPTNLQAKLLRVLQDGTFQRLGSDEIHYANVRLVAATNQNLEQAMSEGNFREDLFYRLSVIHLFLPPLRDRRCDIIPLARRFAHSFSDSKIRFSHAAEHILETYDWPGNIRQLRNAIERACLLSRGEIILPEQLPAQIRPLSKEKEPSKGSLMEDVERNTILHALEQAEGNRTIAAQNLGISRRSLLYKLRKYKEEGHIS